MLKTFYLYAILFTIFFIDVQMPTRWSFTVIIPVSQWGENKLTNGMDSNSITTMNRTKYLYTLSSFFVITGAPYFFQHCSSRKAFVSACLI